MVLELEPQQTVTAHCWFGSGSTQFSVDGSGGVGIGSTANAFALRVIGESTFSGSIVAAAFTGDGRGLTNLETDTLFKQVGQGIGTGIYPLDLVNVGFGTTCSLDITLRLVTLAWDQPRCWSMERQVS